jgi:hypothetical protein
MPVQTRSFKQQLQPTQLYQPKTTNLQLYESFENTFDFDECSRLWRENKNILPNGMYSYKKNKKMCIYSFSESKKRCKKKCLLNSDFCECHF